VKIKDFKHRLLDDGELQEIDFQYQGGMEFIFWYYDMGDTITNDKLISGIKVVLNKLHEGLNFPVAEYNSSRDVTTLMGFTLGQMLHKSFNWKWYYFDEFDKDIGGYTIVSPDETFGICIEDIFFKNVFYKKEIFFDDLGVFLLKAKLPKLDMSSFETYQPWNNDYSKVFYQLSLDSKYNINDSENIQKHKVISKSLWSRIFKGNK